MRSLSGRLLASVSLLLIVFFGLTIAVLDLLFRDLSERSIGELLDAKRLTAAKPPSVLPEDTVIEVASAMDAAHSPVILVIGRDDRFHGVITMSRLLAAIATAAGQESPLVRRRLERDVLDGGETP